MDIILIRLLCVIIGIAFGNIQTAYIYGKSKGIDIREHGSGNAGATNSLRVLGKKAGIIVLIVDIVKSIIAIIIARVLFAKYGLPMQTITIYAGVGTVLGHNYPVLLKLKGGKGIATSVGVSISMSPWHLLVTAITFFGVFGITHYVSLGALALYAAFFIQNVIFGQLGFFGNISQGLLVELYIISFLMTAMAYYKHRENIKRLLNGTENKTYLFKRHIK